MNILKTGALALGALTTLSGCELLGVDGGVLGGLQAIAPNANLRTVALIESPSASDLAAFYCADLAGQQGGLIGTLAMEGCTTALGSPPRKVDMSFVFDTIFDMENGNNFPVPMVELLLAFDVFEGNDAAELAAVCVSFCDPDVDAECQTDAPPEDACKPADKDINSIDDFIPTTNDLVRIASDAISGRLLDDDNLKFRLIPAAEPAECRPASDGCEERDMDGVSNLCCGDVCEPLAANCRVAPNPDDNSQTCTFCPGRAEAHVAFSLGVDSVTGILSKVFIDGYEDLISGTLPSFDIPYKAQGTLFFNVPVLGRLALEFGPLSGLFEPGG